jgi:hypothetical protein
MTTLSGARVSGYTGAAGLSGTSLEDTSGAGWPGLRSSG